MKVYFAICFVLMSWQGIVGNKPKLPSNISQHLYCHGCIATIKELEKILSKRRITSGNKDVKIVEAMDQICQAQNFRSYDYSPPKTVKACEHLMESHEEDIESALLKSDTSIEQLICYEKSSACDGIDLTKKDKKSDFADIDLTGSGGAQSFEVDPNGDGTVKIKEKKELKDGKKKLKKDGKKKKKSKKDGKKKKEKKKSKTEKKDSLEQINIDINDPSAVDEVVKRVKMAAGESKTEL